MTSVDEHVKKLEPSYVAGVLCLVTQSCPALCDSMDCSPPGSSIRGDSPGNNTGVLFPPPGNLPDPGTESASLMSPPLTGGFFITVLC